MSFIEGIGDEVLVFGIIVIVFAIAALVTFIGNRPPGRRISMRQRLSRASEQETIQLPQEITISLRESRRRFGETVRQIQALVHSNERHIIGEIIGDPNTRDNTSANQEASSAEDVNTDNQENVDTTDADNARNTDADNARNTDADNARNTDAVDDNEPSNSETPSAPPVEDELTSDRSESSHTPLPGEIRVRLKYLNDTERNVTSNLNTTIGDFKSTHFQEDIRNNKVVRLIFAGRLLNNNSTLEDCRIVDNSVVHVQILQAPTTPHVPVASQDAELDVSRLLWPAMTAVLGLMWMTYLKYPEFYNLMSLGILLLFTGSYFFFLSHTHH